MLCDGVVLKHTGHLGLPVANGLGSGSPSRTAMEIRKEKH